MNNKRRRGFTLAEMMVAIVIISIVSVTAMTITLSSSKAGAKSERWFAANTAAVNMNECYRSAGGDSDKFAAMLAQCGFTATDTEEKTDEEIIAEYGSTVLYDYGEFTLAFTAAKITVFYEENGEISVIYELER